MSDTIERSQTHATFVIERSYPVPSRRCGTPCRTTTRATSGSAAAPSSTFARSHTTSALVGTASRRASGTVGRGRGSCRPIPTSSSKQRIVFTYDMWVDDRHLSTSLTTIALEPDGDGTRLTYTEQGVHFDGLDTVEGREVARWLAGQSRASRALARGP